MTLKYDVAAYQPTSSGPWVGALATRTSTGRKIAGVEKLVQRFLLELMTEKGSMPFALTRGSSFLLSVQRGWLLAEADVFAAFNIAATEISSSLALEERADDPTDEKYAGADLMGMILDGSTIHLKIVVHNQAGQTGVLTYPVNLLTVPQDLVSSLD